MSFNPIPVAEVELENFDGLKISEKGRTDQCAELEQTSYELGQTKRNLSSLEKKYQATEAMLTEQTSVGQENGHKMDTMKRRLADYASQISDLKAEKEDDMKAHKELRNKIKMLEDTVEEYDHEKEVMERRAQEMSRQINKLQEQLETASSSISELNISVEAANNRSDKSHKELILAMEKHAAALTEKDDEIETVKKTCRGTIYLLKGQIENSDMEAAKMNIVNKDLGQEIILLQGDLDEAEATIRELNNEIPRQQDILEQLNMSLQESSTRVEALQEALVRADMKSTQLGDRNEELEEQLKQSEMQRRLTEQDNIDLHNKITEQQAKSQSLLDTLAKVEARLDEQSESFEAMETEKSDWEVEKRKMKEIVSSLESDNQLLEETKISLENSETKLKNRIRDIMTEQDEAMNHLKNSSRAKVRVLESKVAELEVLLEEETEKRTEADKSMKKMERSMRELELQSEETNQSLERQVEQITTLSNRNKQLKTQFADSEARVTSLQARLRKVTSEVEESENRNATMSKMLSTPAASRCTTPASSIRQSRVSLRSDSAMSWDNEFGDNNSTKPPDSLYTTMIRNSVLGSRASSRLISPEVEQIILSGRNSPVGPLSILSGRNSPSLPASPLIRGESPVSPGKISNSVFDFETLAVGSKDIPQQEMSNGNTAPAISLEGVPEEAVPDDMATKLEVPDDILKKPGNIEIPKQRFNDIVTIDEAEEYNIAEESSAKNTEASSNTEKHVVRELIPKIFTEKDPVDDSPQTAEAVGENHDTAELNGNDG